MPGGVDFPLVNDYKYDFIRKRVLETFLGGPKLRGGCSSFCLNFSQLLLFAFPFVVGLMLTCFAEIDVLTVEQGCYVTGSIMFLFTIIVQLWSWNVQTRSTNVTTVKSKLVDLSEEDSVDGLSCCSVEAVQFIVPLKKYKLNIVLHATVSSALCGGAVSYLVPKLTRTESIADWVLYLVLVTGWGVVCAAQYSLTASAPPEPVVYRTLDSLEVSALMRPVYVLLFFGVHLFSCYYPWWKTVDCPLHFAFPFLPLFWLMGLLPPLDALFSWLGEQILIYGFGGSAVASDTRLLLILLLSAVATVIVYFISSHLYCILVAAALGFILSLNLGAVGMCISCTKKSIHKHSTDSDNGNIIHQPQKKKNVFKHYWAVGGVYIFVLVVCCTLVLCPHTSSDHEKWRTDSMHSSLGYILLVFVVLMELLSSMQQVYIGHDFFVNPLYPVDSTQALNFQQKMKPLNILGYCRLVIVYIGGPLLMSCYLSIFLPVYPSSHEGDIGLRCWFAVTVIRAFRWTWQHPENALLELTVVHFIVDLYPVSTWTNIGLPSQLLIAALIHNRGRQMVQKIHLATALLISSVAIRKQRLAHSGTIAALNFLFLPIVLVIIGVSCVLSAPLLPLFTLPIFLVGFPRPLRTWPGQAKKDCPVIGDAVYYKQLAPLLAQTFQRCHMLGSLGTVNAGDHFLIRFEDRLILVLVLEKGFGFSTVGIKGLELQETSCHAVEATYLDSLLTAAFERDRNRGGNGRSCFNPDPFHVFQPLTTLYVDTYSDTRNVLTGVIDSPDTLKLVASSFMKTLTWVLLHHFAKTGAEKFCSDTKFSIKNNSEIEVRPSSASRPQTTESLRRLPKAKRVEECLGELIPLPVKPLPRDIPNYHTSSSPKRAVSRNSVANSWSDDDDDPLGECATTNVHHSINAAIRPIATGTRSGITTLYATHLPGTIGDAVDHNLEFGLPAVDVGKISAHGDVKRNTVSKTYSILDGPICYSSSARVIAPPFQWLELPFDPSEMSAFRHQFPTDWYFFVLKLVGAKILKLKEKLQNEVNSDTTLLNVYREIILACHVIVNALSLQGDGHMHLRPIHVYKTFVGDVVWSPAQEWLTHHKELSMLVMKAYRYATKLALDQTLMGEAESDTEIAEYLLEYDESWYIGSDASPAWGQNVFKEKTNLFSLGYNPVQRTFTSHLLTLQAMPAHIGRLNPEVVRGLWASLAFELLYLTNDDEERYSIQAHPVILRNLIIQAADAPLGYPLYSSEPISTGLKSLLKSKT